MAAECLGHPCEDAADQFPHAGIGDVFYCDGSCQPFPHPANLDGAKYIATYPDEFTEFEVDWAQRTLTNKKSYGRDR